MAANQGSISRNSSKSQGWTSRGGASSLRRGYSLDSSQRRALERHAFAIPLRNDLLASPPSMDASRYLEKGVDAIGSATGSARSCRPRGIVCRRNVFVGKKRGEKVGKTKRGKGTKIMLLTDGHGLPLGIDTASASPHEVTLIEPLLETRVLPRKPRRLIYDAAADSDPLRKRLGQRGIELICPHRRNRTKSPTQDGRSFRRYRRRWKVERSISWLQNFRRLVTRYEYHADLFHGFVELACLVVVLGRF